jgi:6 kDa early secretory antigenic target
MTGPIKVTFSALDGAQANLATAAGRMTEQLEALKRYLAPMVATWHGDAVEQYQVRQQQWDRAAQDMTLVLAQIGRALAAANESYLQVERANTNRWA